MPETVSRWKALARSQVPFAEAISVLKEVGIDIACQRSKHVDEFAGQDFDYVLTVCDNAKESCPVFFGKGHAAASQLQRSGSPSRAPRKSGLTSFAACGMNCVHT